MTAVVGYARPDMNDVTMQCGCGENNSRRRREEEVSLVLPTVVKLDVWQ